jgi:uroporphyrin-III C-methyltransferase
MAEKKPAQDAAPPVPSPIRSRGRVTLVGAGPGAADLLTLRGLRKLGEADLVLYDALSSEEMRTYAPSARWFYVGKRACRQSIGQDVLNRLMIREAGRGFHVVRLKCGDPFVFGRGGEEMLALAAAGIPCEVVPGVSSSLAGPLLAGIPVTHRGTASAFTVIAGHHEATFRPLLATLPSRGMTLVVLMGLRQRPELSRALLEFGWDPGTPCAMVLGAATPQSWSWRGTLGAVADVILPSGEVDEAGAPGLLVIGDVVAVADEVERLRAVAVVTRPEETPRDDAAVQTFTPQNQVHGQGGTR